MEKLFENRNQSDVAKRKLKSLAKASQVPLEVVTILANFTWDYDPEFGNEAIGWVNNDKFEQEANNQLRDFADYLRLPHDFTLSRDIATKGLISAYHQIDYDEIWQSFAAAISTKNYANVSRFSSYFYLRGLNPEKVISLEWKPDIVGLVEIARHLFLKMFRGGAIERHNLAYLWCDLALELGQSRRESGQNFKIDGMLQNIDSLEPGSDLKDLIKSCKGHIAGDKFFKQEVLQSLCYAGVLRVNDLPVEDIFIAERRNELSPHFYSNEWSFPLRFWPVNGGSVDISSVPEMCLA